MTSYLCNQPNINESGTRVVKSKNQLIYYYITPDAE